MYPMTAECLCKSVYVCACVLILNDSLRLVRKESFQEGEDVVSTMLTFHQYNSSRCCLDLHLTM